MKQTGQMPCSFWAEKLAATHPDDLSPFERLALETHIASCPACAAVRAEYEAMGRYISQLPAVEPLPGIPARLVHLWEVQGRSLASAPIIGGNTQGEQIATTGASLPRTGVRRAPRLRVLIQTIAAVLIVAVLLVGFMLLVTFHLGETTPHLGKTTRGGSGLPTYTWKVIPSPNMGTFENHLDSVTALSASDAWAVGAFSNGNPADNNMVTRGLIEHWNGTQWSVVQNPKPGTGDYGFGAVQAISPNDVWAVGFAWNKRVQQNLIEHWNGTQWSIVKSPNPGSVQNALASIVAVSANDIWAVGYTSNNSTFAEKTLIQHWDGRQWSIISSPDAGLVQNALDKVAVVSANDVWAIGSSSDSSIINHGNQVLIEHWNGSRWSVVSSPKVAGADKQTLLGLAAISSNDIWAVGFSTNPNDTRDSETLIEHWNGRQWSIVNSLNPGIGGNQLTDVVARSANDVSAVGYSPRSRYPGQETKTLVEHWNGTQWSVVKNTDFGSNSNILYAIAQVPHSGNLWAVGISVVGSLSPSLRTLIELYSA